MTAACMLVKRSVFDEVGGLEEELQVAFNDVDFCLKVGRRGYRVVFTPYAELYHHESKTRGYENHGSQEAPFPGGNRVYALPLDAGYFKRSLL